MPASVGDVVLWLVVLICAVLAVLPIVGAIFWEVWQGQIRPRQIPQSEIDALAANLVAKYGDQAEEMAFINEHRAWRYSDSFEQGKWRRVRGHLASEASS